MTRANIDTRTEPNEVEPLPDDQIAPEERTAPGQMKVIEGVGVAPGIAIGPVYLYARKALSVERREIAREDVDVEVSRFERAVSRSEYELKKIASLAKEKLGEDSAAIFEAQLLMLRDEALYEAVVEGIRRDRANADYAVMEVMRHHRQSMESSDSEYLQERAHDLLDVQDRIITHLRRGKLLSAVAPDSIIVAENLTAGDIVVFSKRGILGCALDHGGATSHVSIMARSLGVPAVVSLHGVTDLVQEGDTVILDGVHGRVIINPDDETADDYRMRQERYRRLQQEQKQLAPLPAETLDEHRVHLRANVEFMEELDVLRANGAEGIGLLRTEVLLFMKGNLALSEDEQVAMYREILENVDGHPVTFRMLDLGGDKMLPVAHREHNPFLGWRGIRVLLDRPEVLMPQLRALLRSSTAGNMRLLLPMITTIDEVERFRVILRRVQRELADEGHDVCSSLPLGIMVEVPVVALMAERFAGVVDFFSIGTNDLTQYALAVDRGNDLVSGLYQELHPAVLTLIKHTIDAAHDAGIDVGLCGEIGGNPRATPILVGLGIDELSASPTFLPEVKRVIRAMKRSEAEALASDALAARDADEVVELVDAWLEEHACGIKEFL